MINVVIKYFRLFKVKIGVDLYDSIDINSMIITFYEEDKQLDYLYFNDSKTLIPKGIFDLEPNDITQFSNRLNSNPDLISGLIKCANDEDEDGLYSYIEKKGGELIWINLIDEPEFRSKGALDEFDESIGILVSSGEIEVDSFNNNFLEVNGGKILFSDILGHYEEESEFLILFKN